MKHQWNSAQLNGKFRGFARIGLMTLFVLMFGVTMTSAQADDAQLRVGHFVFDAPAVSLYVNGEVITVSDGTPVLFGSMTLPSEYLDLAAGSHAFALAVEGETLDTAIVGEQEFTLEAGHRYLLAFLGNVSADDLHFSLIDETAALAANDITRSAVTIFINNLTGVPAIDLQFNGQPYLTNLAYGDYIIYQDPTEGSHSVVTAHDDPSAVILDNPPATGGPAHFLAVFAFAGTYSGILWGESYTALYTGQFEGELSISDGGTIAVGDSLPVEFTAMGQRVRYTLTLDAPATLDIIESGEDDQDAFLWMYDTSGNLLREIDEMSPPDNTNDAGWRGLSLEAGTYILEAATFVDIGTGEFTLSVSAAD